MFLQRAKLFFPEKFAAYVFGLFLVLAMLSSNYASSAIWSHEQRLGQW